MSKMEQTRRDFLKLAGKTVLGAAALTAVPAVVKADAYVVPTWPWTYPAEGLDVAEVQKRVYEHFGTDGGCAAGAVGGILAVLAKNYPNGPYALLNSKMFADGAGGYGRQNLCGALGGSFAIFGLFLEGANAKALQKDLYAWYESTALPIYLPEGAEPHIAESVAGSELCKDSFGNWNAKTGIAFGDPVRVNRCRCLTADVAGKAVELLNAYFAGQAVETAPAAPELPKNTFVGVGEGGFGGKVEATVTFDDNGKILKIETKHNETPGLSDKTFTDVVNAIVNAGSTEGIDASTYATTSMSNTALMAAVNDAIRQFQESKK